MARRNIRSQVESKSTKVRTGETTNLGFIRALKEKGINAKAGYPAETFRDQLDSTNETKVSFLSTNETVLDVMNDGETPSQDVTISINVDVEAGNYVELYDQSGQLYTEFPVSLTRPKGTMESIQIYANGYYPFATQVNFDGSITTVTYTLEQIPGEITMTFNVTGFEEGEKPTLTIGDTGDSYNAEEPVSITRPYGTYAEVTVDCPGYASTTIECDFIKEETIDIVLAVAATYTITVTGIDPGDTPEIYMDDVSGGETKAGQEVTFTRALGTITNIQVTCEGYTSYGTQVTFAELTNSMTVELEAIPRITRLFRVYDENNNEISSGPTLKFGDDEVYTSFPVSITEYQGSSVEYYLTNAGYCPVGGYLEFYDSNDINISLTPAYNVDTTIFAQEFEQGDQPVLYIEETGQSYTSFPLILNDVYGTKYTGRTSCIGYYPGMTVFKCDGSSYYFSLPKAPDANIYFDISGVPAGTEGTVTIDGVDYQLPTTITRPYMSSVNATFSAAGYISSTETVLFDGDGAYSPILQPIPQEVTVTINTDVSGAVLTVDGQEYNEFPVELTRPYGTYEEFTLSCSGYITHFGRISFEQNTQYNLTLSEAVTLTVSITGINPESDFPTLTIPSTEETYTEFPATITKAINTELAYQVECTGYDTYYDDLIFDMDREVVVDMTTYYSFELDVDGFDPENDDPVITVIDGDTSIYYKNDLPVSHSGLVDGSVVSYTITCTGYQTISNSVTIAGDDITLTETLVPDTPPAATFTKTINVDGIQSGDQPVLTVCDENYGNITTYTEFPAEVTKDENTYWYFTVSCPGYVNFSEGFYFDSDETITATLEPGVTKTISVSGLNQGDSGYVYFGEAEYNTNDFPITRVRAVNDQEEVTSEISGYDPINSTLVYDTDGPYTITYSQISDPVTVTVNVDGISQGDNPHIYLYGGARGTTANFTAPRDHTATLFVDCEGYTGYEGQVVFDSDKTVDVTLTPETPGE